ncbi:alpha/beta hydrolase [Mycolicibacterium peregrinum]|uniref:alpha/beta fold hydrolase n=1 Tax=Mycolicibacterium peregrinum TaxID=43304 RepID=UPI0009E9C347
MPTLETTDRTDIHYTDTGSGPVLVFTHSWGLNSGQWNQVIDRLVDKGFRCVAYDRRGHGGSGAYDGEWTVDLPADDLARVLDHLDLDDVMLVGHSLGCGEIVRYLSRHGSGRVNRAVLVAGQLPLVVQTADNPDGVPEAMLDAMLVELERDVRQWCIDRRVGHCRYTIAAHRVPARRHAGRAGTRCAAMVYRQCPTLLRGPPGGTRDRRLDRGPDRCGARRDPARHAADGRAHRLPCRARRTRSSGAAAPR